jgi:hypothetical protein
MRLKNHIIEAHSKRKNNHRINWLKSLAEKNEKPIIEILDIVPNNNWMFWEMYWISQLKSWGFLLVNSTLGGENPPSFKGKTHSPEYKKIRRNIMLSDKNPAKNMNENWKNNISKSLKGIVFSDEHKKNLGKPVNQLELNNKFIKKWDSVINASNILKISSNGIALCARGIRNKAGNFKWEYCNE